MRYFTYLILLLSISSCASIYQVAETKSTLKGNSNDGYIFENDTLKITYSFWYNRGIMYFEVYNKLDIPIYIDWKKSAFIRNDNKNNYWEDKESINANSVTVGYGSRNSAVGVTSTTGESVKKERVTFLSPRTVFKKTAYIIGRQQGVNMSEAEKVELSIVGNESKKTKGVVLTFPADNTPLKFRNFLTYSLTENFAKELYVDNEFYISKVTQMNGKQFFSNQKYSPYMDERGFYTLIK